MTDHSTDRYVSFKGIDCEGNARRLMAHIDRHLAITGHSNAFWDYFCKKRTDNGPDDLFLIHSHINQIEELFTAWKDTEALALLQQLEEECC